MMLTYMHTFLILQFFQRGGNTNSNVQEELLVPDFLWLRTENNKLKEAHDIYNVILYYIYIVIRYIN